MDQLKVIAIVAVALLALPTPCLPTQIVAVRSANGIVIGTDSEILTGDLKSPEAATTNVCTPVFNNDTFITWAGWDGWGHTDQGGKYHVVVDLKAHVRAALSPTEPIVQIRAAVIAIVKRDTRAWITGDGKASLEAEWKSYHEYFFLSGVRNRKLEYQFFSVVLTSIHPIHFEVKPAIFESNLILVNSNKGFVTNLRWSFPAGGDNQQTAAGFATQTMDQFNQIMVSHKIRGFGGPFILGSITPEGFSLIDPEKICTPPEPAR